MTRSGSRNSMLGGVLLFLQLLAVQAGAVPLLISVDTTALSGTTGFLDLQFNPADIGTPAALAGVTGLAGDLGLAGAPQLDGSVTGVLPGALQLRNSGVFNSYFQAVQFGSLFSFVVDFSGDFLTQPSLLGSSFSLSLLTDGFAPLLTNDISGSLLRFELMGGNVTFQAFEVNGRAAATVTPVPLPPTGALMVAGMLMWMFGRAVVRARSPRR